ncbi:hypothetical protein HYH03_010669 [Edaphochlamys debaryana]|uniref:Vps72/YL1 C-terminal domain-containing protein n=1 Tax=Edaphochlamys debaryana TaxID=47281 RepID=A0A835XTN9_9CHLO|nr:hypothetical protein HYH03_010669 [Edaphochlamys debaryana]|eukprot:KAG2490997.1 hypothetical protein HYH03_010669 [Edaphochlamys debaryana]
MADSKREFARTTRGKRMAAQIADAEDEADAEFWNQEFFKEEAEDNDYVSESEPEDIIDSDFDVPEEEDDDDPEADVRDEPKKKSIKPPGYKAPPKPKAKPKPKPKPKDDDEEIYEEEEEEGEGDEEGEEGEGGPPRKKSRGAREPIMYVAPTLRRSTVARVAESQEIRQYKAERKTTRRRTGGSSASNWRPLTQSEMLAEAALNEIENTRSLKALLAQEEETKRKAQVVKKKNQGPSVKFRSKQGPDGEEHTTLELINTFVPPPWLGPRYAPPPPFKPTCAITGLPARYTDPGSRAPFANTLAFGRLRSGAGPLAPGLQQQLVMHHHMEEAAREQRRAGTGGAQAGPAGGEPPLLAELRAQSARQQAALDAARQAVTAVVDPRVQDPVPQGVTLDVMALTLDVQRALMAAA